MLNFDEIGIGGHNVNPAKSFAYVQKTTTKKFYWATEVESSHVTVVLGTTPAIGASPGGLIISRQPILGHKELPDYFKRIWSIMETYGWTMKVCPASSSMTKQLLLEWLPDWLGAYRVRMGLAETVPLIVIADGHASRYNKELWDTLREAHVHLILLPAHLTHVFQPVDTHLARSIKKKREFHDMKFGKVGRNHPMRTLAGLLHHILHTTLCYDLHSEAWLPLVDIP